MNRLSRNGLFLLSCLLVLLLPLWSSAQIGPPEPENTSPFKGNLFTLIQQKPLPYDEDISNLLLHSGLTSSASLIQVREGVKSHYHATHDEIVYVLQGKGVMKVGDEKRVVQPGDLIVLERGTVHSVINKSAEPLVALSIICPPFDGKDRIFTE